MRMKLAVFEALSRISRSDLTSAASRSARMVLVDGLSQAEAVKRTGSTRSTVSDAVRRIRNYDEMVRNAYGSIGESASANRSLFANSQPEQPGLSEDKVPTEIWSLDDLDDTDDHSEARPPQPSRPRRIGRRY